MNELEAQHRHAEYLLAELEDASEASEQQPLVEQLVAGLPLEPWGVLDGWLSLSFAGTLMPPEVAFAALRRSERPVSRGLALFGRFDGPVSE